MTQNNYFPCPFCRAEPPIIRGWTTVWIHCSCGIRTDVFRSEQELQEFWNSRVGENKKTTKVKTYLSSDNQPGEKITALLTDN